MVYFTNQPISFMLKVGLPFLSAVSCVDIFERINGRIKAIKSVAVECIPSVPIKASMVNPVEKPNTKSNQPGISKGKSIMKRTYT